MNTCLHSDVPTSLEKSGMLKWKMCACVCDSNTGVCVCVSGRSDSLESPFMAQIISRIREPGQSQSVTESNMFCLETHGGNVQQIQTSFQTLFKIQT